MDPCWHSLSVSLSISLSLPPLLERLGRSSSFWGSRLALWTCLLEKWQLPKSYTSGVIARNFRPRLADRGTCRDKRCSKCAASLFSVEHVSSLSQRAVAVASATARQSFIKELPGGKGWIKLKWLRQQFSTQAIARKHTSCVKAWV